jgi:molybdopterin-guanine dinucleotide biosynthesis protein A
MGGAKPTRLLAGRPLVAYPVAALAAVCARVAIVAKAATELPELEGVERWDEPDEPRHPLTGIVHALERANEPVLVVAADMPYVTSAACEKLIAAGGTAIAEADGILQPVFAVYQPATLEQLRSAPPDAPLSHTVAALEAVRVPLPADLVRSVDTPEQLAAAAADEPRRPNEGDGARGTGWD